MSKVITDFIITALNVWLGQNKRVLLMMMFNIDVKDRDMKTLFRKQLEAYKKIMEENSNLTIYMKVYYIGRRIDHTDIDLTKAATIELGEDYLCVYSLLSFDEMVIKWDGIKRIEFVEVKE